MASYQRYQVKKRPDEKLRIVRHWDENKKTYIAVVVTAITVAGITYLIMNGRATSLVEDYGVPTGRGPVGEPLAKAMARPISILSKTGDTNQIVSVVHKTQRGHPGFMVRHLETGVVYPSQRAAAEALGFTKSVLSGHLNGKFPDVDGMHFERVVMAA